MCLFVASGVNVCANPSKYAYCVFVCSVSCPAPVEGDVIDVELVPREQRVTRLLPAVGDQISTRSLMEDLSAGK